MTDKPTSKLDPQVVIALLGQLDTADYDVVAQAFLAKAPAVSSEPEVDLDEYNAKEIRRAIDTPGSIRGLEPERISKEKLQDYLDGKRVSATTDGGTKPQPAVPDKRSRTPHPRQRIERTGNGRFGNFVTRHLFAIIGLVVGMLAFWFIGGDIAQLAFTHVHMSAKAFGLVQKGMFVLFAIAGAYIGHLIDVRHEDEDGANSTDSH